MRKWTEPHKVLQAEIITLFMSVLLFYNDRYEQIAFSVQYKAMVIGMTVGTLFIPMVMLEAFYENPTFASGLGYAALHLLLNVATITGLFLSPILFLTGTCSCFMIKAVPKNTVDISHHTDEILPGKVVSLSEYKFIHDRRS